MSKDSNSASATAAACPEVQMDIQRNTGQRGCCPWKPGLSADAPTGPKAVVGNPHGL